MTISARDRKILMVLVPIILAVAFYFLVLAPKWEEARVAGEKLAEQQERRDQAVAKLEQASRTQANFATDYADMVLLGKAIPTSVDTPSLLVQLDRAARGTEIDFRSVKAGEAATGAGAASSGGGSASGGQASGGAAKSGGSPQPGGGSGGGAGGAPGGGGTSSPSSAPASGGSTAAGLEKVPLDFKFAGSYFDLASFFHRMKRFVYVDGERIRVQGRLMTLDALKLSDEGEPGGGLVAEIKATVYLSPKAEGPTGGATPGGPGAAPTAGASTSTSSTAASSGGNGP